MKYLLAALLIVSSLLEAAGQGVEPLAVTDRPRVDGRLDEPAWAQAPVVSDFVQRFPREGALPTESTEVRLLYTPDALYIGFRAHDHHPDRIEATALRRDDPAVVQNDQFAFAIDSHNDGRSGFWFSTNPLGVRVDAQFFDEGDLWEDSWNGIWSCAARIDADGWTAEIEIPFSTLRFSHSGEVTMGINLFRRIIRTNESLFAPLVPLQYSNGTPNVSVARKYRFHGIRSGREFRVQPFLLSGLENATGATTGARASGGLDLQVPVTSGFTSYFSANTDFAEVEADELQVNLTRYPLFYPEKREFFLENAGDFSFGLPQNTEVFFSRRIGLSEGGQAVPILFGGRAAGKLGRFDLGVMDVQTRADGDVAGENFTAARIRMGIGSRSYAGCIFTGRYGGGTGQSAGGGDFLLYFGNNIAASGFGATVSGKTGGNSAWYVAIGRGGEASSFHLSCLDVGRNFDPGIGFVRRTDVRTWAGDAAVPWYWNSRGIRNITPGISADLTQNHGGVLQDSTQTASVDLVFQSEDRLSLYIRHSEELVPDPFAVFRDILVPPGRYLEDRAGIGVASKEGRPLSASLSLSTGGFYGGTLRELAPSVTYRLNRNIQFRESFSLNSVALPGSSFRVVLSLSRIDWSLNTKLSASVLAQHDNDLRETAVNFRVTYLFREGTELFVVYDHGSSEAPVRQSRGRLLVKFTYLF